ncbi:isoprenylcysteine carboxylmethyltransferase family protein [Sinimarinibacterium sp. CAU 1509]|uniref:methyltransferase family protein n=1 Tax=Sinimarinibacterium sp. CAU 1509 TaxID=2562283 RepID=UPI0010ACE19D|nr:isoprenylcysteine carboxylmethyltransferase family protein [Sinimarinibacterium sp. CAU 1509]TJY59350.1 isoprenylcysteine carboxylmethyltransferase family protein [Sinimarinibacterium sp. CAU 1509]
MRLFALAAFAFTQAMQLYFIAFIQNWTPRGIDGGAPQHWLPALAIDLGLLAAFGFAHSLMARPAFKRWWLGLVPKALERVIYGLVSALLLLLICLFWSPLPQTVWVVDSPVGKALLYGALAIGGGLILWSIWCVDLLHFTGLRQAFGQQVESPFALRGPYRWVRHPIQSGLMLVLWSTPVLSIGHALLATVLTAYSVLATLLLEERDLDRELGDAYRRYRADVPAFVPRLFGGAAPEHSERVQ